MLNTADAVEGAKKLLPEGTEPGRKCPAVIALTAFFYRPIGFAAQVTCPALLVYAERDTLVSATRIQETAVVMPDAKIVGLPVEHFDFYVGETFEQVVRLEADFLRGRLGVPPS
jgi:hypothetical protein